MSLNRGEWSELYSVIYLLLNNDLVIHNEYLEPISDNVFLLKGITVKESEGEIKFIVDRNGNIEVFSCEDLKNIIDKMELENMLEILLSAILDAPVGSGSFSIPSIEETLFKLTESGKIKAKSTLKEDATLVVLDNYISKIVPLKYSIKSMLGSPATLLNASNNTNFIYKISGLSIQQINEINSIYTGTKLVDRCKKMMEYNADIDFVGVESHNFEYNLKMIDSNMPYYLSNILFQSYATGNKNLKELFLESNLANELGEEYAMQKLGQFLQGISFDFFPNTKWNGKRLVNGGLIIVKTNGNVGILDLIYTPEIVLNYLINNTKLDSPSFSRYRMFEIYEEEGEYYFKLNLQVRYIR